MRRSSRCCFKSEPKRTAYAEAPRGKRRNWTAHTPGEVRLSIEPLEGVTFTEIEDASKQVVDSAKGLLTKILVEGLGVAEAARHFAPLLLAVPCDISPPASFDS
jgi:hypothetical protein